MFGNVTYDYDTGHLLLAFCNLAANTIFLFFFNRFFGFRILEPATWYTIFHYILFAFRPVVLFSLGYHGNYSYMGINPDVADTALVFFVANLAFVSFIFGTSLMRRTPLPVVKEKPKALEVQTFIISALVFSPLYLFSIYYGVSNPIVETNSASSGNIMIDPETGRKIFVTGSGYFYVLKNCFPGLVIAHLIIFRPNVWNISVAVIFLTATFLEGRGRFVIIYFVLGVIIYYFQHPRVSKAKKVFIMLFFSLLALVLISIGGVYRRMIRSGNTINSSEFNIFDFFARTPMGDSQEFGMFEFLTYIVKHYPDADFGYSFFTQYLEIFTKPIPRALWSGKPVGSPIQLIDLDYFGNFQGLTQSMAGAGWLSFGFIGVFILAFLSGLFLQSIYFYSAKRWNNFSVRSIYIVSLPFCLQWFRDGAPSIVEFYVFGIYPLLFWSFLLWLARRGYLPLSRRSCSS